MTVDQKILTRLDELIELGNRVLATRYSRSGGGLVFLGDDGVDFGLASQWGTSCLGLLERVFGRDSSYFAKLDALYQEFHDVGPVEKGLGIVKAAKDDIEHGFLFNARVMIAAEVFDDFMEQAEHLLSAGYHQPAAIIVGCVLEDGLRKLCQRRSIRLPEKPKLDQMNSDLARQGAYNQLVQKKVTALADLRNKAAHGRWDQFGAEDVAEMLRQVRSFMENHLA